MSSLSCHLCGDRIRQVAAYSDGSVQCPAVHGKIARIQRNIGVPPQRLGVSFPTLKSFLVGVVFLQAPPPIDSRYSPRVDPDGPPVSPRQMAQLQRKLTRWVGAFDVVVFVRLRR